MAYVVLGTGFVAAVVLAIAGVVLHPLWIASAVIFLLVCLGAIVLLEGMTYAPHHRHRHL